MSASNEPASNDSALHSTTGGSATTAGAGTELAKSYDPRGAEAAATALWRATNCFHAEPLSDADREAGIEPYCIVIPPPNVTAALHLGHALNNTLQDVLIRFHRMNGRRTLWMPGTDHAGIATQTVVEKRLLRQGKRRADFTREAFIAKVQEWKDEYEATILEQLEAMGCSCDSDRVRFTMDEVCARAVREGFFRLFSDGLIYRGKRLVNWDPVTETALADDEVEMRSVAGHMWYLRYPLEDGSGHVTVATTRPETMLGDTAVAVNPRDPRATDLRGKRVLLPIVGRSIPIVEDDYVVMPVSLGGDEKDAKAQIATGFLKVTPAHDPNDWEIGRRHELEAINVMAPDGSISDRHGWDDVSDDARAFVGLSREDARERIVAWFDANGLLEKVSEYEHSVGHSYRSHVPIEPWLSDQWYVRVTDDRLRGEALRALDPSQRDGWPEDVPAPSGRVGDDGLRFHPERYAKTFQSWHENIRDWCISRQLWWGHRIPVWTRVRDAAAGDPAAGEIAAIESSPYAGDALHHVARALSDGSIEEAVCVGVLDADSERAIIERIEADGFAQDPDVLDTWFSSGLWPMSTMGWPEPDRFEGMSGLLESFNPSSVLCTARDIITLWVSRMVMFNRYFRAGTLPFTDVFIHAMIQDGHGQRMSKSLGNGLDPRDILHSHGADAMRFSLAQLSTNTQDVRMPVDLVCPFTGERFEAAFTTTPAGHVVAAPVQESPHAPGRSCVTGYGVASGQAEPSDDVPLARNTSSRFDAGRNFANKLWNAARFALGVVDRAEVEPSGIDTSLQGAPLADRWIVARLHQTEEAVRRAIESYQFSACAEALYDFVWRDFCDWYLEAVKPTVASDPRQLQVLRTVLDAVLRLLHPVCPFVTETLRPAVHAGGPTGVDGVTLGPGDVLATCAWPEIAARVHDVDALERFARSQALVGAVRTLRAERGVKPKQRIEMRAPRAVLDLIEDSDGLVETLAGLASVTLLEGERPATAAAIPFEGEEVLLDGLVDAADLDAERARLEKVIAEKEKQVRAFEGKLANESYVAKAPAHLVEETRRMHADAASDLEAARQALGAMSG